MPSRLIVADVEPAIFAGLAVDDGAGKRKSVESVERLFWIGWR